MNDRQWDKKLNIHTTGREDYFADEYHHPYEPTPYSVLVRLAESGYIEKDSTVIDYGCGKGRVGFFLNWQLNCHTVGIEYEEKIFQQALENLGKYGKNDHVEFICTNAEDYEIKEGDCFYFFNPFSVEILKKVLGQIKTSYYEEPRPMRLFFYYPNEEFVSQLITDPDLDFLDEIDCRDLFPGNNHREQILVFELEQY